MTHQMTREVAVECYPGAKPDLRMREVRDRPERDAEHGACCTAAGVG